MFYKKTQNAIWEALQVANLERQEIRKNVQQLEKRINTIADYIQGPYTQQINQNFKEIQMQLEMTKPTKKLKKYYKQFDKKKVK